MKKAKILLLLIILFIAIRSIHFSGFLNFSYDQANFSIRSLELWNNKEFTLVGPGGSLIAASKPILYGSINYYFQLFFMVLGGFDPVKSSYVFMLFAALMIAPLFYGVELLSNKKAAYFAVIMYTLVPLFIDFTRFFFAPNFQLSLLPIMFLGMGLFRKTKQFRYVLFAFFWLGIIFQFHFAMFPVYFILIAYYFFVYKLPLAKFLFFSTLGCLIGIAPILFFEIKNDFYNMRVILEYFQTDPSVSNFELLPHRYLVFVFVFLILLAVHFKKRITTKLIVIITLVLLGIDLWIYLPAPKSGFGMSANWNYPMEKKAYEIIRKENLKDFNVVNHIYDNKAIVIKYLMKINGDSRNYDDYYNQKYLFVISDTNTIFDDPAYELNTFQPNKKLKMWRLNNLYNLYLFKRVT